MIQSFAVMVMTEDNRLMDIQEPLFQLIDALDQNARDLLRKAPDVPYHLFQKQVFEKTTFLQTIKALHSPAQRLALFQEQVHQWLDKLPPDTPSARSEQGQALLAPSTQMSSLIQQRPCVTVIGAGTAGLLAAYVLVRAGYTPIVYEARSREHAFLRPQNISFKEAERRLKPLIGEACYARFLTRGGALDGHSGKLRITIGAFQEILTEELLLRGVEIHYRAPQTLAQIQQAAESGVVLLTTGVHSHAALNLTQALNIKTFPQYTVLGRTALYLEETDDLAGYSRYEREGFDWRRVNKTVYDYDAMSSDVDRILLNLKQSNGSTPCYDRLTSFSKRRRVNCTFIFGNDTDLFLENLEHSPQFPPVVTTQYQIIPSIALSLIIEKKNAYPIIAMGDLNGSPHPLAAIGTLKIIRNLEHFLHFLNRFYVIRHLSPGKMMSEETNSLLETAKKLYVENALQNTMEVFLSNILCCIYSSQGVRTS